MRGIIIGVKEEEGIASVIEIKEKEEGVMAVKIWVGEERWRIVRVYVKGDMERKLEVMKEWLEEQEEGRWTMIGADFNARTGGLGGGQMAERKRKWEENRKTGRGIDEELEAKIGRIGEELKEGEREYEERKKLGWWDKECEEKRKELRRTLGKWRRRGGGGEGGVEGRVRKGGRGRRLEDGELKLRRSEVRKVVEKLKKGKAMGVDGVPNEGEGWPELWKDGIIVPLVKRGAGERVEEYRGVTLMPTLYKVYIGVLKERLKEEIEEKDVEKVLRKGAWGGVKLGEEKVYCLAYADDMVLLAENKEGMVHILGKLEGYLDRKRLEVNVGKTKIMRFWKGGGRMMKVKWRWKGKIIEEVKKFTYLGYKLQRNGGQEAQVKDRVGRDSDGVRGRDLGVEREEGDGGDARKMG
ncbi:neurofilament medium polypeptide-like protein [Lasius niger]|uniref:Neurofilament medium polypeptide-like protein n=1 Tax=Lasius niger TaxID=67767 RepID=A0A0J7KK87_LASNI|nr:neurofilament medium polypeptide-like protein [Lasius niger]